jgi:hypothetical protein
MTSSRATLRAYIRLDTVGGDRTELPTLGGAGHRGLRI